MIEPSSIAKLLEGGAADSVAIGATDGLPPLRYRDLRALAQRTVETLNALGIGRNDRVAIVLPNGPEMASSFVCIASGAAAAPLNPTYHAGEFEFFLGDLAPKALVVAAGVESPCREAARKLSIPLIELRPQPEKGAGIFSLKPLEAARRPASRGGFAESEDTALVLHTSGTTSRPKMVPLMQRNVAASARNIGATLALAPGDVCLNVMPLFHIHGLVAATLASLAAGAQVCCTPGFNALRFFHWLDEVRPTWYTAVPSMHQAILARAGRHLDVLGRVRLRLIRSSSAPLPLRAMVEMEKVFGTPVIESYGMTETAHQIASNLLPPRDRKRGSVGVAAGPEVAIMDPSGNLLPPGATGEVVVRGPSVTPGYEGDPAVNAGAFAHGWFHTGDEGVLDDEGYLRITGRLKELINRGGEKVSPLEVDEALMEHPAVQQVVTFAMPHPMLGEEVAAAVVLREGKTVTDHELHAFAANRLAHFKVPRKILVVHEIPKGATGKLQRIGLAAKLGLVPGG